MTNRQIRDAYDKINISPQAADEIWLRAMERAETEPQEKGPGLGKLRGKTFRRTLLIAAVIASLMTVTAVASEFYGIKTVTREDSHQQLPMATTLPDGSVETTVAPVMELGGTRPYDGPDWAMEWVNTAQTAFAEWRAYKDARMNAFFTENMPNIASRWKEYFPTNEDWKYDGHSVEDNGDGTYTITCFSIEPVPGTEWENIYGEIMYDLESVPDPETAITVDKVEMDAFNAFIEYQAKLGGYGGYHHIYAVWDGEEAAKLEEIAAKYGLILRSGEVTVFGGEGSDNAELNRQLSEAVGTGLIYQEAPEFDHYSTFASGSFQSMASIPLTDGRKASTYICSTVYNEMVDGREVGGLTVREDVPMVTRSYTAADGTELAISQNDTQAIIYAYLDSSYINITVTIDNWVAPGVQETDFRLSEDAVNYVADCIHYKNIGK